MRDAEVANSSNFGQDGRWTTIEDGALRMNDVRTPFQIHADSVATPTRSY